MHSLIATYIVPPGRRQGCTNIEYYGILVSCGQKYVKSFTSRTDLKRSRVKFSPTSIPLYLWYLTYPKKRTPPTDIELVATKENLFFIFKLYVIVNDESVPLQEGGGMGNDFWRVPVVPPITWLWRLGVTSRSNNTNREGSRRFLQLPYLRNVSVFVSRLVQPGLGVA